MTNESLKVFLVQLNFIWEFYHHVSDINILQFFNEFFHKRSLTDCELKLNWDFIFKTSFNFNLYNTSWELRRKGNMQKIQNSK